MLCMGIQTPPKCGLFLSGGSGPGHGRDRAAAGAGTGRATADDLEQDQLVDRARVRGKAARRDRPGRQASLSYRLFRIKR